jgi:hypothetical protein
LLPMSFSPLPEKAAVGIGIDFPKGGTKQQRNHSWAIYHIRGTPAQFIGLVFDQPDEQSAIAKAIEEYNVPANQRDRLMARRRD